MLKLAIKTLIVLLASIGTQTQLTNTLIFIFLLLAITITGINQYYHTKKLTLVLTALYTFISLFLPSTRLFLPILFFDLAPYYPKKYTLLLPLVFLIGVFDQLQNSLFLLLLGWVVLILAHLTIDVANLGMINKEIYDTNASQKKILTLKNQMLLESQGDVLHMAKLQERNRIARDIHDTIGHALSRALLQTGALSAINQNDAIQPAIDDLKATLTNSMNAIRNSIHDLKDDSIDLKPAISDILDQSGFKISFTYDISDEVPNEIKNCFLIVLKESITNTSKHSDATKITVTVIEHPAIYQFLVADNGTKEPTQTGHGIGLQNIAERINELGGYLRMNYDGGFRTFITIPKKEHNKS